MSNDRPDPDDLLKSVQAQELEKRSARLRIFLGMSAGVGKTYAMLKAAHQRQADGCDVVIGLVETHGRPETEALLAGLELFPRKKVEYKGATFAELDLDGVLKRRPEIVIIDELAHSNVPGLRHQKRYQDVIELLEAGIDVYTAINVQHLASRKDAVESVTSVQVHETVPDGMIDRAGQIELVDIAPAELLKRLKEGKVYLGDRAERAAQNFFKEDRLTALREIALRLTAERVDQDLRRFANTQNKGPWQTNERLLVAVSHSPYSEKLIRATRRLAYNLEAPWVAVHIDTGLHLSNEDQTQLARNLTLARELKAEVVTTAETDVSAAIKRIARQKNVTQILVGRPTPRWFKDRFYGGSLLDRLVRENMDLDVHVVSQDSPSTRKSRSFDFGRLRIESTPRQYWKTFLLMAFVTAMCAVIEPYIGYRSIGFIFLLCVLILGTITSIGPILFSSLFGALAWNYFFLPPRFTFMIRSTDDAFMCGSFLIVAITVGYLTNKIRFHELMLREREDRSSFLYEILQDISGSQGKDEFLTKIVERVGKLLNGRCAIFVANQSGELNFDFSKPYAFALTEKAHAVASWAFQSGKPAGWSTETLAEAKSLFLPIIGQAESVGILVYNPKTRRPLGVDEENLLHSVTHQLGVSLERHFIDKRLAEASRYEESEKLHQTLLNSISHEMRTPLTTIMGTASALAQGPAADDPTYVRNLSSQLMDATGRLNRVIENLLDMSRFDSGHLSLNLEWHDCTDLIGVVVAKLAKELNGRDVQISIAEDAPLIKMDFRLMEHAISNLVLNATIYTPREAKIRLSVSAEPQSLTMVIEDAGPGIPEADRGRVFDKFYRVPGTPTGGTGLGLSIVKSIIEAHGGHIEVAQSALGGARFTINLPNTQPPTAPEMKP